MQQKSSHCLVVSSGICGAMHTHNNDVASPSNGVLEHSAKHLIKKKKKNKDVTTLGIYWTVLSSLF